MVFDSATNTGFLAGGQPAVLDQNLIVTYGITGLPLAVIIAENTIISSTNTSTSTTTSDQGPQANKERDKDKGEKKEDKELSKGLKAACD